MTLGKIITISAPSGSGKSTIIKYLLNVIHKLKFSVSCTTRHPRLHEINGVDYFFISKKEFYKKIMQGSFIEWENVYPGIFYGTLKYELETQLLLGNNIIFDLDVIGAMNIKRWYRDRVLSIFLSPPSLYELSYRLYKRNTECNKNIYYRLIKAKKEIFLSRFFDLIIINDDLMITKNKIRASIMNFISC
jgi:guanylate kinase